MRRLRLGETPLSPPIRPPRTPLSFPSHLTAIPAPRLPQFHARAPPFHGRLLPFPVNLVHRSPSLSYLSFPMTRRTSKAFLFLLVCSGDATPRSSPTSQPSSVLRHLHVKRRSSSTTPRSSPRHVASRAGLPRVREPPEHRHAPTSDRVVATAPLSGELRSTFYAIY